jgi:hypothetical protein
MKLGYSRPVPAFAALAGGASICLVLGGCLGAPDFAARSDPLVVTEAGTVSYAEPRSPERMAAVAEMRARGEAGDAMPYPDVFQSAQTARLAAREEPRPVADADAIEGELAAIARRQAAAISPTEIAALKARAAELRRLAAEAQAGALRR